MKHFDLEQKIKKLNEIAENTNPLIKWDEEQISREATEVNQDIFNAKKILLEKKGIEEKIKEADKKLDEQMKEAVETYNHSGMAPSAHIRMFASTVAKLNEIASELDNLINVQKPNLNKIIFEEEIEKKEKLIPIWNNIKDFFKYNELPMVEKEEQKEEEDEIITEIAVEDEIDSDDEEILELKKFIAASMEPASSEVIDAIEDVKDSRSKKKKALFKKKRA